jgi:hypothetical protein
MSLRPSHRSIIISKRKESLQEQYRADLVETIKKSQDSFETQLPYIAAGGIGVSMAFISDIIPLGTAQCIGFLYVGWLLLIACLFTNFFSHDRCIKLHQLTVNEIDCKKYKQSKAKERDSIISRWNYWSIWTMITGITSILLFITLNTLIMAKEVKPSNPSTETKGRTAPTKPPAKSFPVNTPKPDTGRVSPTNPPKTTRSK